MSRLLLVDGDPRSLNVLGVSLTQAGYEVTSAGDGLDALAKIEGMEPQLVIAAVRLRKADGFELVRKVRERPSLATVPVILIGNDDSVEERRRAHELGVDQYLTRPIFVRELVARVHLLFARQARQSLAELQRRGDSRLSGSTRDIAVVDLVQSMDAAGESGVLHMSSGTHKARLYFRDGHVVDADLGTMRGEEAVYRAFLWYDALFELELRPVTNPDVIVCSTQTIVRKGMQRIDAWLRSPDNVSEQASVPENSDSVEPSTHAGVTSNETPTVPAPPPASDAETPRIPTTSRSSAAPWTREIEASLDDEPDEDVTAAGLPRRTRKMKGLVAMTVALAAGVLLAAGVRSSPRWHSWRASSNGPDKQTETAEPAAVRIPPSLKRPAADMAGTAPTAADPEVSASSSAEALPESPNGPLEHRGSEIGNGPSEPPLPREAAPAAGRETPIDSVKLASGNLSPLVRDAQRALLKGQTEHARSLAEQAVSERPFDADAWLTLAAAQRAAGDLAAARETYLNCIQRAETPTVNHCRILASRQRSSEAHASAPAEAAPAAAPAASVEVAQSAPTLTSAAPRLGIHAPEVSPSPPTSSSPSRQPPPASSSTEPAPPGSSSDSHG